MSNFTNLVNKRCLRGNYPITSDYGPRGSGVHVGIDFGASYVPLYAFESGVVTWIGNDSVSGNFIYIYHPAHNVYTFYCHLSSINVTQNQNVTLGQQIGVTGNTGNSDGPHLHIGIKDKNNKWLNPNYCFVEPYGIDIAPPPSIDPTKRDVWKFFDKDGSLRYYLANPADFKGYLGSSDIVNKNRFFLVTLNPSSQYYETKELTIADPGATPNYGDGGTAVMTPSHTVKFDGTKWNVV